MSPADPVVDGRTLRHQHRRAELLAGAVEYILEHGLADLSLRPIAKWLGVTHSTLLRQFGSKEELVVEVVTHIRVDLLEKLGESAGDVVGATLADSMWATWRHLCEPSERRQFALLFELVGMQARDPDRFGSLVPMLITDFLGPIEASMRNHGLSARAANELATGFLAQVRGLQLDLAVSGDQPRIDAAMHCYIDTINRDRA